MIDWNYLYKQKLTEDEFKKAISDPSWKYYAIYSKSKPISNRNKKFLSELNGRFLAAKKSPYGNYLWLSTPKTDKRAMEKFGNPFCVQFIEGEKKLYIYSNIFDIKKPSWRIFNPSMKDFQNIFKGIWDKKRLIET